jgi:hypothetical protein
VVGIIDARPVSPGGLLVLPPPPSSAAKGGLEKELGTRAGVVDTKTTQQLQAKLLNTRTAVQHSSTTQTILQKGGTTRGEAMRSEKAWSRDGWGISPAETVASQPQLDAPSPPPHPLLIDDSSPAGAITPSGRLPAPQGGSVPFPLLLPQTQELSGRGNMHLHAMVHHRLGILCTSLNAVAGGGDTMLCCSCCHV